MIPPLDDLIARALAQPGGKRRATGYIKFQCPACAAEGHDRHKDNATLTAKGRWGCALDPGGQDGHRAAIARVLGCEPDGPAQNGHDPDAEDLAPEFAPPPGGGRETLRAFLEGEDEPERYLIPGLLPEGVLLLVHGEPRAKKSLFAFELALAVATGTPAFGLERLTPTAAVPVLYVMEEDPRALTRTRLRALTETRCGPAVPDTLEVIIRRGLSLDDPGPVGWLIGQVREVGARLLVLDAARRLSAKTDEGPAKVREFVAVLRTLVDQTGCALVIVHHDVKPPRDGDDTRRRGHRASGGDWFAACECPVHLERLPGQESLVFPEDYKFGADPAPFTFHCEIHDRLVTRLVGAESSPEEAEQAGPRGKLFAWLAANPDATRTTMKQAGLGRWETIEAALAWLIKAGKVDAAPGRKKGSLRYFVIKTEPSPGVGDDSRDPLPF